MVTHACYFAEARPIDDSHQWGEPRVDNLLLGEPQPGEKSSMG